MPVVSFAQMEGRALNSGLDATLIPLIIERLEMVRASLPAYMGDDIPAVVNFLHGFGTACKIMEATSANLAIQNDIFIQHGWRPTSFLAVDQVKAKGLSSSDIATEILTMTIENWKAQLNKTQ